MPNMSYCRFHNTLLALESCHEHLGDHLSSEENEARKRLLALCREIVADDDEHNYADFNGEDEADEEDE
jgi:hypothetical protein